MKRLNVKLLAILITAFGIVSEGKAAPACPTLEALIPDSSDPSNAYILSKYHHFYSITEQAKNNYLAMSPRERDVLQKLVLPNSGLQARSKILFSIENSQVLSLAEKKHLADLFKLREPVSENHALDTFRMNYEYFFWTDHSENHMQEVLAKSRAHERTWPAAFVKPYEDVLQSPVWKARIEKAIHLHDALMSGGRTGHAEYLLQLNPKFFAPGTREDEMHYASLLAFLHSKSLIPYADLPNWAEVLQKKSFSETAAWNDWIQRLSGEDKNKIAKAAAWIRMADADRPIGTELRNSLGDSFQAKHGEVYVRHQGIDYLVSEGQKDELYGAVVLNNLNVASAKDGNFLAQFKTQLPKAEASRVQVQLNRYPLLDWIREGTWKKNTQTLPTDAETRSIAYVMCSILADFPPNSFKSIQLLP